MARQIHLRVACEFLSLTPSYCPYSSYTNLPYSFRLSTLLYTSFLKVPSYGCQFSVVKSTLKLVRWHRCVCWWTFDTFFTFEDFLTTIIVLGREYAAADFRWGLADPTVVSLELLTVLGAGPLCCYILKQLANDDPARHYWLIVLSTAEIYGGFVP